MPARTPRSLHEPPRPAPVDPCTGIVPFLMDVEMDRGDPDVFVVVAETADTTAYGFPHKVASNGSGAALSRQAAYGAAVGECIERYALSIVHPEDLLLGSYGDLFRQGESPIAPHRFAFFDPSQFGDIPFVPFHEDTPVAWARAASLTRHQDCLVPACFIHVPYTPPFIDRGERLVATAISTGTACSDSRGGALLKGICELVERDAVMIMWRNRLSCPRVQIDPASDLYAIFVDKFLRPGLEYTLVYTTLDLSIPSFFGILTDTRRTPPGIVVGGAAHLDPCQAALKTLLELVQGLKWMDYADGQHFAPEPGFRNVRSFTDRARLYASHDMSEAIAFVFHHSDEILLSDIPSLHTGTPHRDLGRCVSLLDERGLDVLGVDLTPCDAEECGLYVTKAIIPECETMEGDHLMPYLGGRRWRLVPYHLGLLDKFPTVASINPYPHPYP
jgi:ribosomal protein S12 methylthiotransferase accessory factor